MALCVCVCVCVCPSRIDECLIYIRHCALATIKECIFDITTRRCVDITFPRFTGHPHIYKSLVSSAPATWFTATPPTLISHLFSPWLGIRSDVINPFSLQADPVRLVSWWEFLRRRRRQRQRLSRHTFLCFSLNFFFFRIESHNFSPTEFSSQLIHKKRKDEKKKTSLVVKTNYVDIPSTAVNSNCKNGNNSLLIGMLLLRWRWYPTWHPLLHVRFMAVSNVAWINLTSQTHMCGINGRQKEIWMHNNTHIWMKVMGGALLPHKNMYMYKINVCGIWTEANVWHRTSDVNRGEKREENSFFSFPKKKKQKQKRTRMKTWDGTQQKRGKGGWDKKKKD